MKRRIVLIGLLWIALLFGLAACGQNKTPAPSDTVSAVLNEAPPEKEADAKDLEEEEAPAADAVTEETAQDDTAPPETDQAEAGKEETVQEETYQANKEETDKAKADNKKTSPENSTDPDQTPASSPPENLENLCTLSIRCDTLAARLSDLSAGVASVVPPDGTVLAPTGVPFEEGDSVFDVLKRETRSRGIHMEFQMSPMYHTAYIEGIANLYEFDGGPLSGWLYRVNGTFPNYGCSAYPVSPGDTIEWLYTCDLGKDVGAPTVNQQ